MIYLAQPYTHPDPLEMEDRYRQGQGATAKLLLDGLYVYSPISMCHPIALEYDLPFDFEFWRAFDFDMINHSEKVIVLMLTGWEESVGVTAEIMFAQENGIPVEYMEPV